VLTFIVRRILYSIPILLGTTFLLFVIFNVVPGDPAYQMAGKHATVERIAEIRAKYGFDQPWYGQYFDLVKQLGTFDFGVSYSGSRDISELIFEGMEASLSLLVPPFILSILVSLALGVFVAMNRGTWIDKFAVALSVAGQSVSVLVYIILGQYLFASKYPIFPVSGYSTSLWDRWEYLMLPALIYILLSVAPQLRFYRTAVLDEMYQDYVRTAKSKGLGTSKVMFKHVLKNAMIPIITDVVISIPFLILGALLLERYFSIPGLGGTIVNAIENNDRPVLIAITFFGTLLYVVFNLISDVLYAMVDPRVELK
jgi:peptide/nickel transport system permease protein